MSVLTAQQTLREGLPAPDEVIPTSPDRGKREPPAIYPLGVSHYKPLSHPGRGLPRHSSLRRHLQVGRVSNTASWDLSKNQASTGLSQPCQGHGAHQSGPLNQTHRGQGWSGDGGERSLPACGEAVIQVQEGVKGAGEGVELWSGNPGPGKRRPSCSAPALFLQHHLHPCLLASRPGEGCWRLSSEPEEQSGACSARCEVGAARGNGSL